RGMYLGLDLVYILALLRKPPKAEDHQPDEWKAYSDCSNGTNGQRQEYLYQECHGQQRDPSRSWLKLKYSHTSTRASWSSGLTRPSNRGSSVIRLRTLRNHLHSC